jgi:poly-gamma-glutamate synthesis protein (capsule biosynthesis protein)
MATTLRDIDTVFGLVRNDRDATVRLLQADDIFDDSDLFSKEHGIAALLPFVRHFFPDTKIVPIAISYNVTRAECDRALELLESLVGLRTLVVQSTDYSHYLRADIAQQRDQETLNIIAADDADAVFNLNQPDHMDSRASQYVQMKLQRNVDSHATVIANRNSAQYSAMGKRTTSYVVTVYSDRLPTSAELHYSDQAMIYFGGDSFVGRWLTEPLADKQIAAAVVHKIRSITNGAPMVVNLEGVVMDEPPTGISNDLHVMHASLAVPILKALNVKVAGLANNHSFDLGPLGYQESRTILKRNGIVPLGHGEIVDVGPFRLLGLNFIGKFDYYDYPVVKDGSLAAICDSKAPPQLLALVHWGEEYTNTARSAQYEAAEGMEHCGVAAIVGSHTHRAAKSIEALQGGEYAMVYSLGNLLFDQTAERSSGALLELRIFKQGTFAARLIPIPNLFEMSIEQLHGKQHEPIQSKPAQ